MSRIKLEPFTLKENAEEYIGMAHIFNNYEFPRMKPREGTEKDVSELKETLPKIGFNFREHKDVVSDNCISILKKIAVEDGNKYASIMIIFLTHGSLDELLMSDGLTVSIKSIMQCFNGTYQEAKAGLEGKPIIFLFQACQGSRAPKEIDSTANEEEEKPWFSENSKPVEAPSDDAIVEEVDESFCSLPCGLNLFAGFASSPGYVSFRNTTMGSRFIQTFTTIINNEVKFGDKTEKIEFMSLMTKVTAEVAMMRGKNWPYYLAKKAGITVPAGFPVKEKHVQKQIPWFSSTLSRRLEFTKYSDRNSSFHSSNTVTETVGGQDSGDQHSETTQAIESQNDVVASLDEQNFEIA